MHCIGADGAGLAQPLINKAANVGMYVDRVFARYLPMRAPSTSKRAIESQGVSMHTKQVSRSTAALSHGLHARVIKRAH